MSIAQLASIQSKLHEGLNRQDVDKNRASRSFLHRRS